MNHSTATDLTADLRARDSDPAYADAPVIDGYARISISREGDLEKTDRQIEDILTAIHARHARLGMIYRDDNLSAWKLNGKRPGWTALVGRLESGATDGVQVWRTDRLMRQPRDLENLLDRAKNGSKIFAVDGVYDLSRDQSQLVLRIKVAMAYEESLNNSLRQKRKQEALRMNGNNHGGPRAFGEPGTGVSDDQVEAERAAIVDGARRLLAGATLAEVAEDWTSRGLTRGKSAKPINYARVKDILSQPRIAGIVTHEGVRVARRSNFVPIISEIEFDRLQARFATRTAKGRPYARGAALTGGVLTCAECGHALSSKMNPRGTYVQAQYVCSPNGGCGRVSISAAPLEAIVRVAVCGVLASPSADDVAQRINDRVTEARLALTAAESALTDFAGRLAAKELSVDEWKVLRPALITEVECAREALADAQQNADVLNLAGGPCPDTEAQLARWDQASLDDRRAMARGARMRITVRRSTSSHEAPAARITIEPMD